MHDRQSRWPISHDQRVAFAACTLHFRRLHNGNHAPRRKQMNTDTEGTMHTPKLDHTFSSLVEIDLHALQVVTGAMFPDSGGGSETSPAKSGKLGKTKRILCGLGMLGCAILGPERPGPA